MSLHGLRKRKTRLLIGLLLMPALALTLLVPRGFMPGIGAAGTPTIQMCHGAGPLPGDEVPSPGQGQHPASPCIFAAAGATAPPPAPLLALEAPRLYGNGTQTADFVCTRKALHRLQAARAPPVRFFLS